MKMPIKLTLLIPLTGFILPLVAKENVNTLNPDQDLRKTVYVQPTGSNLSETNYLNDSLIVFSFSDETDSTFRTYSKYSYNNEGQKIIQYSYNWSETEEIWSLKQQFETGYNAYGFDTTNINLYYNAGDITGSKIICIKDATGNILSSIGYSYKNNNWIKNQTTTNYLNDAEKIDSTLSDNFDETGKITKTVKTNTYYTGDNLDSIIKFNWDTLNNNWKKHTATMVQNLTNGTISTNCSWDTLSSSWASTSRYEYYTDINGYDSVRNSLSYNTDSAKWYLSNMIVTEYNAAGIIQMGKNLYYVSNDNAWICPDSTIYSYNSNNQKTEEISYHCEDYTDTVPYSKKEYFYDENENQYLITNYTYENNDWSLSSKSYYHYIQYSQTIPQSGINEISDHDISYFPNPANDIVYIQSQLQNPVVAIFSIEGRLINTQNVINNSIDLSNINKGIYLLRISEGNNPVKTIKLIKE